MKTQAFKDFLLKRKIPIIIVSAVLVVCITAGALWLCGVFGKKQQVEQTAAADEQKFQILSVEPTRCAGAFMATDSGFLVHTEYGSAELVRQHIYISNAPEYTVSEKESGTYEVSIKGKFDSGKNVKVQFVKSGAVLDSWAFETETKLEVASHYPYKEAYGIADNSVIEIEMSLVPDQPIDDFVTISPEVSGRWEQSGKVFRFIPSTFLTTDVDYKVTVAAGMTAGELSMDKDYTFKFYTYKGSKPSMKPSTKTVDSIAYYKPNELINIRYSATDGISADKISIYKFESTEDMIAYVSGEGNVQTTFVSDPAFSTTELATQGSDNNKLTFEGMASGCYVANVYSGSEIAFEYVFQVNPISAYAAVTSKDILVWTENSGVTVKYNDTTATTNDNGIAILEDAMGTEDALEYIYVGDADPVVIGTKDLIKQMYPNCYLYVDKPKYKTTDTVRIWGCMPMSLFYDAEPDFELELVHGSNSVKKLIITPDENGTFETEISFKDLDASVSYGYVKLTADNEYLATQYFDIDDYELQNYSYTFSADKNYVWGDNYYDFDVKVEHVSGMVASGKRVRVSYNGEDHYEITDNSGVAHFSIFISNTKGDAFEQELSLRPIIESRSLSIGSGDVEENGAIEHMQSQNFYLVKYDKNIWKYYGKGDVISFQTKNIDTTGIDKIVRDGTEFNVETGCFETTGTSTVYLHTKTRERIGEKFNPNTNTYQPIYSQTYESVTTIDAIDFSTTNGYWEHDFSSYTIPDSTEFVCYSLRVYTVLDNKNGHTIISTSYLDNNYFRSGDQSSDDTFDVNSYYSESSAYPWDYNETYQIYEYIIDMEETIVKVNDSVSFNVNSHVTGEAVTDGKVLCVVYNNSVVDTHLFDGGQDLSFIFTEENVPGVSITCAYYKDGKFWRTPSQNISVDEESRNVIITSETTADKYAPGDEVTVKIKTTDVNGKPLSCTVNLSAVNEAVFGGEPQELYLSNSMIGSNKSIYDIYTVSTYRNYDLTYAAGGGKGGGGDEVRYNFADTACFKSVITDDNGNAEITFTLPDSITTYRMTMHAASEKYYYGTHVDSVSATTDFFLQSSAPRGLKDTDDFVANANTIVAAEGDVEVDFEILETSQKISTVARAGASADVNFGKLPIGEYTLRISAAMGDAKDAMEYKFVVVSSALTAPVKEKIDTTTTTTITPTAFPVIVDVYSKSTEKYLEYLDYLQTDSKDRYDKIISFYLSESLKNEIMGTDNPQLRFEGSDEYRDTNGVSTMFRSGAPDLILTAFDVYYGTREPFVNTQVLNQAKTPRDAAECLLIEAANGEGVLYNLGKLEPFATDDYTKLIISLAYSFAGDYENAKRVYDTCSAEVFDRGYQALRATVATFVEPETAQSQIDVLLAENNGEYYLPFAVTCFIQNRSDYETKEYDVKITANEEEQNITLHWLEVKQLVFYNDGSGKIDLSFEGEDVAVQVQYQDYEKSVPSNDFSVRIENCNKKYDVATLVIDLERFRGQNNMIEITLPANLRVGTARNLKSNASLYAKHEKLTVYTNKNTESTIRIPLIVIYEGEYVFESIRLTDPNGQKHYSQSITIGPGVY